MSSVQRTSLTFFVMFLLLSKVICTYFRFFIIYMLMLMVLVSLFLGWRSKVYVLPFCLSSNVNMSVCNVRQMMCVDNPPGTVLHYPRQRLIARRLLRAVRRLPQAFFLFFYCPHEVGYRSRADLISHLEDACTALHPPPPPPPTRKHNTKYFLSVLAVHTAEHLFGGGVWYP